MDDVLFDDGVLGFGCVKHTGYSFQNDIMNRITHNLKNRFAKNRERGIMLLMDKKDRILWVIFNFMY